MGWMGGPEKVTILPYFSGGRCSEPTIMIPITLLGRRKCPLHTSAQEALHREKIGSAETFWLQKERDLLTTLFAERKKSFFQRTRVFSLLHEHTPSFDTRSVWSCQTDIPPSTPEIYAVGRAGRSVIVIGTPQHRLHLTGVG